MGFFSTLSSLYVLAALVFQAVALGFIALDNACSSKRPGWLALTLLTGPIGLLAYLFKGRS
ncbi:MAG: hypothetical protein PHD82_14120 [Candidatus Riflebacteria bacterium]|jgi:hypothetical protein|nr:hypothetical protein [Candidatus Riflebacteria bacterium]